MININGTDYYSYAEAIIALQELVETLQATIDRIDPENLVTKTELSTELTSYVKTDSTDYTTLVNDNKTHNANWTNIITDLKKLAED